MADYTLFIAKAPGVMRRLMSDFDFDATQSAAVLGNIGHECAGFRLLQEQNPTGGGRGGYGWCQWTGPRRRAFEAYAARSGLPLDSDAANYGYLVTELRGDERRAVARLKLVPGLVAGVRTFEQAFLRAGVKHYPSRERYAEIALAAFGRGVTALRAEAVGWSDPASLLAEAENAHQISLPFETGDLPDEFEQADMAAGLVSASALAPEPPIHGTEEWGAMPPARPTTILPARPKGIVIHHTTDPNTADRSLLHAFSIARSIQKFHMGPERNWIDTGQHFTVSRGGHVMEGRHRSLEIVRQGTRHVLGAHADAACNRDYVGIENEGLYTAELPPQQQWDALVRLCAWIISRYGMTTAGIIGHRQCKATECPGERFFGALPKLRADIDKMI